MEEELKQLKQKIALLENNVDYLETLLRLKDKLPGRPFFPENPLEGVSVQDSEAIDLGDRDIIKLKTIPLKLAGHDLRIFDKTEFTWDEAVKETKELKSLGWRLPTAHEWVMIVEELALTEDGDLDRYKLLEKMGVEDSYGVWWSSTSNGSSYAFALRVDPSGYVYPRNSNFRSYGFSVRLVRDVEEK